MKALSDFREQHWPALVAPFTGAFVLAGGLATFLGWALGIDILKDWFQRGVTMKANPSIAAVLAGTAILLLWRDGHSKLAVRLLGMGVLTVGALTLYQHLTGLDLGIDQLLFREAPGAQFTAAPGRMGPPASTMFALVGLGLILGTTQRGRAVTWMIGLAVSVMGLFSLSGYLFGANLFFGLAQYTGISAQMALLGVCMGCGLIASIPDRGPMKLLLENSGAGMLVRQALPMVILSALSLGWFKTVGDRNGLFDEGTGRALLILALLGLLCGVLWRGALMVSSREQDLKATQEKLHQSLAQRKAAQEELEHSNELLEQRVQERTAELVEANEQLNGFTHSIAHDLRQSIRGIVVNSQLLLREHSAYVNDDGVAALGRLERAGRRMAELVDDLLNYARVSKLEARREPVDVTALARAIAEDCGSAYPGTTVEVEENMSAHADPGLLRIVLENLFDNACKYVADGQRANVLIGHSDGVFFVRDNGIGFDAQYATRIFEPFERLVATHYEGTGIGLANVKRIIAKHGGSIWCESSPGAGTTFYFTLEPQRTAAPSDSARNPQYGAL